MLSHGPYSLRPSPAIMTVHILKGQPCKRYEVLEEDASCFYSSSNRASHKPCTTGQLQSLTTRIAHVLPVSDDGGSTAEIVRVLGGPAVGDIRSRCLRLADDSNEEVQFSKCMFTLSSTWAL